MSEGQYTSVCSFDPKIPRITAYQIHEWLHDMLHLHEDDIRMILIDGQRWKVYIKFIYNDRMMVVLQPIRGPL
jgi:hypothetical protein